MCDGICALPNHVDQKAIEPPPPSSQRLFNSEICLRRARSVTSHQWSDRPSEAAGAAAAAVVSSGSSSFGSPFRPFAPQPRLHRRRRRCCCHIIRCYAAAGAAAAARHYEPFSIIPFSLCDTSVRPRPRRHDTAGWRPPAQCPSYLCLQGKKWNRDYQASSTYTTAFMCVTKLRAFTPCASADRFSIPIQHRPAGFGDDGWWAVGFRQPLNSVDGLEPQK